jgi:hypothetical protein
MATSRLVEASPATGRPSARVGMSPILARKLAAIVPLASATNRRTCRDWRVVIIS